MNTLIQFVSVCCVIFMCHARDIVREMEIPEHNKGQEDQLDSSKKYGFSRQFSFASYFGDNMVLQAAPSKALLWGYAPMGTGNNIVTVLITPGNQTYSGSVTSNLTWAVQIGPVTAGGPHRVVVKLGNSTLTMNNVMFGDVWVCSGQSNMHFPLTAVFNGSSEVNDTVNYPDIRIFVVKENVSTVPLSDFSKDGILLPWSISTPDTIKDSQFSAVCWLYGKLLYKALNKPIGLVETSVGGTPVEAWSSKQALHNCGLDTKSQPVHSDEVHIDLIEGPSGYSVLWNAMVHPFINMTIYGVIWYQGERNADSFNRDKYNCTFPAMIDQWRKSFSQSGPTNQLFPFGFVQLAGNRPDRTIASGFPDIRWHQTADYGYVPNHRLRKVFMAVAMDLPDFTSPMSPIHPRDKQDVALRLSLGGLAVGYGRNMSYQGPYPVQVTISQSEEPYNYTQVQVEYSANLEQRWLDGFEVCCAFVNPPACVPGKSWWLPTTTMQGYDRGNITLSYASECTIHNVVGLRYSWRETPCPFKKCAIYGASNGLPMPPFTYHGEGFRRVLVKRGVYSVMLH